MVALIPMGDWCELSPQPSRRDIGRVIKYRGAVWLRSVATTQEDASGRRFTYLPWPFNGDTFIRGTVTDLSRYTCREAGSTAFVPRTNTSGANFDGRLRKEDFIYDAEKNEY